MNGKQGENVIDVRWSVYEGGENIEKIKGSVRDNNRVWLLRGSREIGK